MDTVLATLALLALCMAIGLMSRLAGQPVPKGCIAMPGPKGLPWLGPVHQLPRFGAWFTLKKWANQYGPIFAVNLAGQTHVFLSQETVASRLLSSRGSTYSGRPAIPTLFDSQSRQGTAEYLPLMSKNDDHTRQKKFGHHNLAGAARQGFYNIPAAESKRCIQKLSNNCSNWQVLTEEMTSRIASRLAWGSAEPAAELRCDSWTLLTHISPAGFLTNLLPQLMYLPTMLSPWKQAEKKRHAAQVTFLMTQLEQVRQQMISKTARPSYMRTYLEAKSSTGISDDLEAAFAIGMLAITAIYTISSPMSTFIRAAALHPQWLRKVQEEMDRVVGDSRLPDMSDSPNLPWLRAFIKECLRWQPPIPTGIPHELEQDDTFEGYFLPKGARIHPVEYAFCRDPETYPEPERFNPERWMSATYPKTYREPLTKYPTILGFSSFGWGRRYCLGQTLAWHELIVFCGGLIWAFEIKPKGKLENVGMEMPTKWDESLIIARPRGPELEMTIRSQKRRQVLDAPS